MVAVHIHTYPDPILRIKTRKVEDISGDTVKIAEQMIEMLTIAKGVGLAANQVGIDLRMFVMNPNVEESMDTKEPVTIINPEIVYKDGFIQYEEGCLSLPDLQAKVGRAQKIILNGINIDGNPIETSELEGLLAVCSQHEIDHLDGILFIDRISRLKREILLKKYLNEQSKMERQAI